MTIEGSQPDVPSVPFRTTFDAFYMREYAGMVTLAYAVSGSRLAAEDLAQEAMIRAHRNWDRISQYDKPGAWVRRVTINLARSSLRRRATEIRSRMRFSGDVVAVPEPEAEEAALWEAVKRLPARQRAAIALHYLDELSVREIADILECAEATAKVHLHRGRKALAEALSGTAHDPETTI